MPLENDSGEDLGEVDRLVVQGDRTYIVLSDGGFLGMGGREVALPLDRITGVRGDDELVLQGLNQQDIDAMPRWNGDAGRELGQDDEVAMHVRATANTGATREDVLEALLHVAVYAGVPAANHAIKIAKSVYAEIDKAAEAGPA